MNNALKLALSVLRVRLRPCGDVRLVEGLNVILHKLGIDSRAKVNKVRMCGHVHGMCAYVCICIVGTTRVHFFLKFRSFIPIPVFWTRKGIGMKF